MVETVVLTETKVEVEAATAVADTVEATHVAVVIVVKVVVHLLHQIVVKAVMLDVATVAKAIVTVVDVNHVLKSKRFEPICHRQVGSFL